MIKVLVIDDNLDMLEIMEHTFKRRGFDVATADSGFKALRVLEAPNRPNVIFLDYRMPDMSGLDFLTILQYRYAHTFHTPIILFTAMDARQFKDPRVVKIVQKPTDMDTVVNLAEQYAI